jgi:WD40 repeat protein
MKNGLIAILVVATVGLSVVIWLDQRRLLELVGQEQAKAEQTRIESQTAVPAAQEAARAEANRGLPAEGAVALKARDNLESRHSRYRAQVQRARLLLTRDPVAATELLEDEEVCPKDLRDFTWHLAHRLAQRERFVIPDGGAAALSIDGRTLAVALPDGSVTIRQTATGAERARLATRAERLAVSLEGNSVATDDGKGTLTLWDVEMNKPTPLKGDPKARLVGFAPDGQTLVGCTNQEVFTWKLPSGEAGSRRPFPSTRPLVLTDDGRVATLVGDPDKIEIVRLDLMSGTLGPAPVKAPAGLDPGSALLSSDGRTLASASEGKVVVWDAESGQERLQIEVPEKAPTQLAFTAYGQTLITRTPSLGRVRTWDLSERQPRLRLAGLTGSSHVLECSRDGQLLVVGSTRGDVLLDLGADPARLSRPAFQRTPGTPAALSANGTKLAVCDNGNLLLWDVLDVGRSPIATPLSGTITRLIFAPDQRWLAVQIDPEIVRIFDFQDEQKILNFDRKASQFAFSRDSKALTTVTRDGLVQRLDTGTCNELNSGKVDGETTLSPDGNFLAVVSADRKKVTMLDAAPLKPRAEVALGEAPLADLLFTDDGNSLFTRTRDGRVARWDLADGRPRPVPADLLAPLETVPFWTVSRDGQFVATASKDGSLRLWDLATGLLVRKTRSSIRPDQGDELTGLTRSLDGHLLVLTGREKEGPMPIVQFFDGTTGEEVGHNLVPPGPVEWLAFAADGRTLALGSRTALLVWTAGGR